MQEKYNSLASMKGSGLCVKTRVGIMHVVCYGVMWKHFLMHHINILLPCHTSSKVNVFVFICVFTSVLTHMVSFLQFIVIFAVPRPGQTSVLVEINGSLLPGG